MCNWAKNGFLKNFYKVYESTDFSSAYLLSYYQYMYLYEKVCTREIVQRKKVTP